jgi:hypothetical protein
MVFKWTHVAQDCSHRSFTHPADTLPALSGLAQCTNNWLGQYIASLWEMGIAHHLAWHTTVCSPLPSTLKRPTFFWISSPVPVYFPGLLNGENYAPLCILKSHKVITSTSTSDGSGKLSYASITLAGPGTQELVFTSEVRKSTAELSHPLHWPNRPVEMLLYIDYLGLYKVLRKEGFGEVGLDSANMDSILPWNLITCFAIGQVNDLNYALLLK